MGFASFVFCQIFVHPPQLPHGFSSSDQVIIITGSNTGIGLEAARQCVSMNAKILILALRSVSNGEAAKSSVLKSYPYSKTRVEVWNLDMESFDSIKDFGSRANALPQLDVCILNAGVFKFHWTVSKETGFESSLMVNHLANAMLSVLLLPVLKRTAQLVGKPTRLTMTSSEVHMWTPFKEQSADSILAQFNDESFFRDAMDHYSVSKLLNVFWAQELASRISENMVVINMINPGSVNSGLHRDGSWAIQTFDRLIGRTSEEGGRLLLNAALVQGPETHGKYLSEAKIVPTSPFVRSEQGQKIQTKLWLETVVILKQNMLTDDLDGL